MIPCDFAVRHERTREDTVIPDRREQSFKQLPNDRSNGIVYLT